MLVGHDASAHGSPHIDRMITCRSCRDRSQMSRTLGSPVNPSALSAKGGERWLKLLADGMRQSSERRPTPLPVSRGYGREARPAAPSPQWAPAASTSERDLG